MRGLTLIEVLVAMGIATIVGVLLLVIIVNSAGLFTQQSAKVQTGLNINDALSIVRGTIKQANAVEASSSGELLVLKVASIDSGNNIIPNTFDSFVFSLDQSVLHFKVFPDPGSARFQKDQILGTSVTFLNFQYFNSATPGVEVTPGSATKVRISLTLKQKIGANFEGSSATSEANLRND